MKISFIILKLLVLLVGVDALAGYSLNKYPQRTVSRSSWRLYMRKDSQKPKKSKTVKGTGSSASGSNDVSSPRRVQTGTGVSVRKQIEFAKAHKRLVSRTGDSSSVFSPTRKFKQPKAEKREQEEYVEIDFSTTKPPAMFVDGYNVIGYLNNKNNMVELEAPMSMEDARDSLVWDLCVLAGATGWMIEVVFDAYRATRGSLVARSGIQDGVMVTYTGRGDTADTYIERRMGELQAEGYSNTVVVTDDQILRSVGGAAGNGYMPVHLLVEEIQIAYASWDNMAEEMVEQARRKRPKLQTASAELALAMRQLKEMETLTKETEELRKEEAQKKNQLHMEIEAAAAFLANPEAKFKDKENTGDLDEKGKASTSTSKATKNSECTRTNGQRTPAISVSSDGVGRDGRFTAGMALSADLRRAMEVLEQEAQKAEKKRG